MSKEKYYDAIIKAIPEGKENALHMKDLAVLFSIRDRDIRQAVLDARIDGYIILSDPSQGYFTSSKKEDIAEYYRLAKGRIDTSRRALKGVKKYLTSHKEEQ